MKRILLGLALAFMGSGMASADTPFCSGYEAGYARGWCSGQYGCMAPLPPMCPMPNMGEDGYQDGYDRGFTDGRNAR